MAKSRFEYVRMYEEPDPLLRNTFIVVRLDGKGFHKFSDAHAFVKPNDKAALDLMDRAAKHVMSELPDVVLGFGESDEYSFLLRRSANLYNRRRSKICSTIVSLFTSAFVLYWPQYLPGRPIKYPPCFDGRVVLYPTEKEVRDYFAWRQADTHINNLYNTCFWALVNAGSTTAEANKTLQASPALSHASSSSLMIQGTDSGAKNELLFSRFGINYNSLAAQFRKGSTVLRWPAPTQHSPSLEMSEVPEEADQKDEVVAGAESAGATKRREKKIKPPRPFDGSAGEINVVYEDIIGDAFWRERPWLLT